jgi:hypothetical protein
LKNSARTRHRLIAATVTVAAIGIIIVITPTRTCTPQTLRLHRRLQHQVKKRYIHHFDDDFKSFK